MRPVVVALLGLIAGADPAQAQAWLTVADADGRFRIEMPVPFDMPPSKVESNGTITFSYVHETPELALRFEVVEGAIDQGGGDAPALVTLVSRVWDGERIVQMRSHVVGRRTYRVVAISTPELESDTMILRFMDSVRLPP
jgi:hypothetical protein